MSTKTTRRDPNTLSNYDRFTTTHTQTNFIIDFDKKILTGNMIINLIAKGNNEHEIILDTSYLDVHDVKVNGKACEWELRPRFEPFGSPLKIALEQTVDIGETLTVDVGQSQDC